MKETRLTSPSTEVLVEISTLHFATSSNASFKSGVGGRDVEAASSQPPAPPVCLSVASSPTPLHCQDLRKTQIYVNTGLALLEENKIGQLL